MKSPALNAGLLLYRLGLKRALPHVAGVLPDHGLAWLAAPRLLKLRHVLHYTIDAILTGRVFIGLSHKPCDLF
jgi:hypothetical protein